MMAGAKDLVDGVVRSSVGLVGSQKKAVRRSEVYNLGERGCVSFAVKGEDQG